MSADEIRKKYIDFMSSRGYTKIAPVDLILKDDPTTLFTGSGMQPMIPYLLGAEHPTSNQLVNSQPCVRTQDIDEVGDNRHTTFFEMLGDWSLKGFDKKQQIEWLFEFLTKELGLDPNKLYVTCFIGDEKSGIPRDDETANIWAEVFAQHNVEAKTAEIGSGENGDQRGMKPGERIFFYDDGQNWWSRNGGIATTPKGDPCGPDNEVFYDFGDEAHDPSFGQPHPASDSGRFVEICNKVWMQYMRSGDGSFEPLTDGKVDFGGGLSRMTSATLGKPDIFLTSLYLPIIEKLEQISGENYASHQANMRVIADHLTAAVWLAAQGLTPSNKEQGYVMRRLVRRAIRFAFDLGIQQNFLEEIVPVITNIYADSYPAIEAGKNVALAVLVKEEKAFRQTLRKGLKEFEKLTKTTKNSSRLLLTISDQTIDSTKPVTDPTNYRLREAARAVVTDDDDKIALIHAQNFGYYKLPGGGIESGEDKIEALRRELLEETGTKAEILGEIGQIEEEFRDDFQLHQISYCYYGKVIGEKGQVDFTKTEQEEKMKVIWVEPDEALRLIKSGNFKTEKLDQQFIATRDEKFLTEYMKLAETIELTGAEIFILYDTYGFPVELSVEEAYKREIPVSENWRTEFDNLMQKQREMSQTAAKGTFKGGLGGQTM